ncbi:MAG: sigma 54-interacting transcriptional regulator [Syntrophomonas sp.]
MKLQANSYIDYKTLDTVLNGFDGALVVDENGLIVVYTDNYAEVTGLPKDLILGKYVLDVFPDSRMMEVVNSGEPVYIDLWQAGAETVFVSRYPIIVEGEIVGAVAVCVFRYLDEARKFAERVGSMGRELQYYKTQLRKLSGAKYSFDTIIGASQAIMATKKSAEPMVKARTPVLILGETGTGKELFAHAIHQASPRRDRPFIRVNCASIPESLVESELFGYEEGAFSGARKGGKPGKFELANGGTIFLDEINELPYHVQAKLLRVLQEGEIDHVGGTDLSYIDVRVLSATSADLSSLIKEKLFREDLYYRINAFQLRIPPLRERIDDIRLICDYLIENSNSELGTDVIKVDAAVLDLFFRYQWPGNVRELRNVIQRACLIAGYGIVRLEHLPPEFAVEIETRPVNQKNELDAVIQNAEKEQLLKVLGAVGWNRNRASEMLGINRTQLYRKMKKHDLLKRNQYGTLI